MARILIAEDNDLNRELFCELLAMKGHAAEAVTDGLELLIRLKDESPDLLLVDIQMPKLDGFQVIRRLKADTRLAAIPAVALTAFAMEADKIQILSAGFDAYVTKPIDRTMLFGEIDRCLEEARARS